MNKVEMIVKEIIVRMPNWLGDSVMATPIVHDLKNHFPDARLTIMCKKGQEDLFYNNPAVNEVFTFTVPNAFLYKIENRDVIGRIRQGLYDLGILLPNSFTSAWWFFRGKVKKRIGFRNDGRDLLLTTAVKFPATRGKEHLVNTYKKLLQPLGVPHSDTAPELFVNEEERKTARTFLKQYKIPDDATLIGINPHAAYGPAKCWPKERYLALAKKLMSKPNRYILFFGDNTAKEICASICNELDPSRAFNLAGATTLRLFIAILAQLDLFVTNDSGPMHLAAAIKTPLIAIFGSTSDIATGPYRHGTVIHKHVACSPCFKRVCPIDFRCMTRISVDEVYAIAEKKLEERKPQG